MGSMESTLNEEDLSDVGDAVSFLEPNLRKILDGILAWEVSKPKLGDGEMSEVVMVFAWKAPGNG
jgi:hypothetical protein